MSRMKKVGAASILMLLITVVMLFIPDGYAEASGVNLPDQYYFVFDGRQQDPGSEFEMKTPEALLSVTAGTWDPSTSVTWVSSEPGVVRVETTPNANFIKLVRVGPGYSTITAIIGYGSSTFSVSCLVKVGLEIDYQRTGTIMATTIRQRIAVLNNIGSTKQVYLKYVDYVPTGGQGTVTGSAIQARVSWESENEDVVTVDEDGLLTAVGAGCSVITVTTETASSQDMNLSATLMVVVQPTFALSYDANGVHHDETSVNDDRNASPAIDVPSNFVLVSNATAARNLKWVVRDLSNGSILSPASNKLTYSISTYSGNVVFSNVKAGTYEIYAFADEEFDRGTNAPYAYMKIIVPIDVSSRNIIMSVGDTYSILDNSNIPGINIFTFSYIQGNPNIAQISQDGIITAKRNGFVRLRLVYRTEMDLFEDDAINSGYVDVEIDININVIDAIKLSMANASLYTSGTLMLHAIVTDPTYPITWSSSDPAIARVEEGLVTGIRPGIAYITASQTINGIVKTATCEINVIQSVTSITIEPRELSLHTGQYQTLHASLTPSIVGAKLVWKSSNTDVVRIIETSGLTATIQGVAGGYAVISAINQDNVVIGYCHVNVRQPVTSIVLSETSVTMDMNTRRLQLRATVYPENAQNKLVTFTSTDQTVARVDSNGMVTVLKPGTVTIIATSADNPAVTAMCNITVHIPVVSVALDEKDKVMYVGETARLSYTVLPSNATNSAVTWTSMNSNVATVDNSGRITARSVGTTVIVIKTVDGAFTEYCNIEVNRKATDVRLEKTELTMRAGETYKMKAELLPSDSTEGKIIWESSDTRVAIVNQEGEITAREAGQALIMIRTEGSGIAICKLTVTQPVKGLLLNFDEKTIYKGESFTLKVSLSPSEATNSAVIWKSSRPEVASISAEGVIEGLSGGTTLITCTTVDGGYTATCIVTVLELITTIKLDHESIMLAVNKSITLEATVSTQTASNKNVTWQSSNPGVATVNSKGKVTGVKTGFAIITAVAQDGSKVKAECEVEVVVPATRITLDKTILSMYVGDTRELKATITPKNTTYKSVTWISSDPKILLVDEDGVITALSQGNATITAKAQDGSGKEAMCYVTVNKRVPATGVTLVDKKLTMVPGEEKVVKATTNPIDSTDSITWSTDNASVARVDSKTGKITARSVGTAIITVMTDSGRTAVVEVTVIGLNITELTLEQYTTYTYLTVDGATSNVTWDISNRNIAELKRVNNNTIAVSSRATGTATITAKVNGRTLTCKLKVVKIGQG